MPNSNEYMRVYMQQRYYRRREWAIDLLGGHCVQCGRKDDLHFDHRDARTKLFAIGKCLASMPKSRLLLELNKCQLLCSSCHIAKTIAGSENLYNRYQDIKCSCGKPYKDRLAYAGHRRWCHSPVG